MGKIYVITQGEYSDYSIHSIWSTKEKAEDMLKILNLSHWTCGCIEEFDLDSEQKEKRGVRVLIDFASGEMITKSDWFKYPHSDTCVTPSAFFKENKKVLRGIPNGRGRQVIDASTIEAVHFTLEQALKSARDLRAKKQAEIAGI